ncbi:MAG: response regulator [Acidobacteriaceae bacterium]
MVNVLIVDDSRFLRQYTRLMLERLGLRCEEAADGAEALARLQGASRFDCMLLDLNMPVMGGLECVRELRSRGLQAPMKVMMVTTESDHSFIRGALECGADEFLMKPFTPACLREKLAMLGVTV